jgi:hypothetical protein
MPTHEPQMRRTTSRLPNVVHAAVRRLARDERRSFNSQLIHLVEKGLATKTNQAEPVKARRATRVQSQSTPNRKDM